MKEVFTFKPADTTYLRNFQKPMRLLFYKDHLGWKINDEIEEYNEKTDTWNPATYYHDGRYRKSDIQAVEICKVFDSTNWIVEIMASGFKAKMILATFEEALEVHLKIYKWLEWE